MDNKVTIVSSVLEDVFELAPNLRQDDINELKALGLTPQQSLLRGFVFSEECFSVKAKGKTIGLFGVSEEGMPKGFGSIWFLGADELNQYPVTFVKEGIRYTKQLMQKYDIIINAVDTRNTSHVEWIQRIGMSLSNPLMINGYEFLQFYKVKGVK